MKRPEDQAFQKMVYRWYRTHGRHTLPWRTTHNPYRIAVSEIMLQQTGVDRVILYYRAFIRAFPTVRALAAAPLASVLTQWSGLGYNRRAVFLHRLAQVVVTEHKGVFPRDVAALEKLPGIGRYTARAIAIFAYDTPEVCIETNIRTVYLHHFFPTKKSVRDATLATRIAATLDRRRPREWYGALMDYGSFLKKNGDRSHRKSAQYKKQSPFEGSRRQVRGRVLRALLAEPLSAQALATRCQVAPALLRSVIDDLVREGVVTQRTGRFQVV